MTLGINTISLRVLNPDPSRNVRLLRKLQLFDDIIQFYESTGAKALADSDVYIYALYRAGRYDKAFQLLQDMNCSTGWAKVALYELSATFEHPAVDARYELSAEDMSRASDLLYYLRVKCREVAEAPAAYEEICRLDLERMFGSRPYDLYAIKYMRARFLGDASAQAETARNIVACRALRESPADLSREQLHLLSCSRQHSPSVRGQKSLVSVIMTTYEAAAHLYFSAKSILAQTYQNIELIIVDDAGSDDGTRLILQRLVTEDARVSIFRTSENVGTYVAKNLALKKARGRFVTFHDSDDWAHPRRIEEQVRYLNWRPWLVATQSMWIKAWADGQLSQKAWGAFAYANPASIMVRRSVFSQIGYFDTVRIGADSEFNARIQAFFGAWRYKLIRKVLTIGTVRNEALTASGLGEMDARGYNPIRASYEHSWRRWHLHATRMRRRDLLRTSFSKGARFIKPPEMPAIQQDRISDIKLLSMDGQNIE